MKKCAAILVSLALLTACSAAPADSVSATPVPTETPAPTVEPTSEPTATPSPTPAPTMAVYDEVSFDDWRGSAGCTMPDYTFSAPHKPQPQQGEKVVWPTEGVTLRYSADSLEEVAEIFHTTVENIKELNPDWQDNYSRNGGRYWGLKVQADPYTLPMNNVVTVTVNAPWVEGYYDRTEVSDVPASLTSRPGLRWPRRITSSTIGLGCMRALCPSSLWRVCRDGFRAMRRTVRSTQSSRSSAAFCTQSIPMLGSMIC